MTQLFAQQLEDARSTDGTPGVIRLWIRSLVDLIATAPTEHLEPNVLVAKPVVGIDPPPIEQDRASGIAWDWMIAALAPGLIALALAMSAPHFMGPMFEKPPEALGLPLGTVIIGLSVIWYAIGVAIVGVASRLSLRLVAILVFVFPATFALLFGPALILILQNMTA
jgi:hypothetical protein